MGTILALISFRSVWWDYTESARQFNLNFLLLFCQAPDYNKQESCYGTLAGTLDGEDLYGRENQVYGQNGVKRSC